MQSKIQFINEKVKEAFEKLKIEDPKMYDFVSRAFEDIENNVFCGVQIPKNLIPKEYIKKYNVKNL